MDDEGGDWFNDDTEETPQETAAPAEAAADSSVPASGGEVPVDGIAGEEAAEDKKEEEDQYLDPDKLLIFKHWIR